MAHDRLRAHLAGSARALTHRNFRLFFLGQAVSLIGSWTQMVAQGWLVYHLTGQGSWLGLVGFAQQAPIFVLGLVSGTLIDRVDKHRLVFINQCGLMACAVVLAVLTLSNWVQPEYILVLALVIGTINAFDIPGRQSWMIDLVGREDLPNAIALNSTTFNLARMVGPALAGALLALVGPGWCFALNALTFVAVLASLAAMDRPPRQPPRPRASPLADMRRGFGFIMGEPTVRQTLALLGLAAITVMPAPVLMPMFAEAIHRAGPVGLGMLMSCLGAGALLGALRMVVLPSPPERLRRIPAEAAAVLGVSIMLFAAVPQFWLAAVLLVPAGFAMVTTGASANTLVQSLVPDELRGRVMAVYASIFVGLTPFGAALGGWLSDRFGAPATVITAGAICAIYALWRRIRSR